MTHEKFAWNKMLSFWDMFITVCDTERPPTRSLSSGALLQTWTSSTDTVSLKRVLMLSTVWAETVFPGNFFIKRRRTSDSFSPQMGKKRTTATRSFCESLQISHQSCVSVQYIWYHSLSYIKGSLLKKIACKIMLAMLSRSKSNPWSDFLPTTALWLRTLI